MSGQRLTRVLVVFELAAVLIAGAAAWLVTPADSDALGLGVTFFAALHLLAGFLTGAAVVAGLAVLMYAGLFGRFPRWMGGYPVSGSLRLALVGAITGLVLALYWMV